MRRPTSPPRLPTSLRVRAARVQQASGLRPGGPRAAAASKASCLDSPHRMPQTAAQLAAAALGLAFLAAALVKVLAPSAWRGALRLHELPGAAHLAVAVAVPGAELAVAGLAAAGRGKAAAGLALLLLALFSLALLRTRARGTSRVPCGCFGRASSLDARAMLARNALLATLAGATLLAPGRVEPLDVVPPLGGDALVPATLALGGVALTLWAVWAASTSLRRPERQ